GDLVVGACACVARSLGDVLRDVCGHRVITGPVTVGVQRSNVELGTPAKVQFADGRAVGGADLNPLGGGAHGGGEPVGRAPGRGFVGRSVGAVEADDGVHVDGRPFLVLGDAREGQPGVLGEAGLYEAGGGGEAAAD